MRPTSIGDIPAAELARTALPVIGLAVGIDQGGTGAIIKFRTETGEFLFFFPPNTCHQWAVALRRAGRKHRWRADGANEFPMLTPDDWGSAGRRQVGPTLLRALPDAALAAIQLLGSDLVQALRMPPHLARQLGEFLWEPFRLSGRRGSERVH